MASEVLVEAQAITRRYPGVKALSNVSIAIKPGAVHVVAGENGAGKSTLVKILTGTELPSEGEVRVLGRPVEQEPELFKRIGYVPQELSLFPHLTHRRKPLHAVRAVGFRRRRASTRAGCTKRRSSSSTVSASAAARISRRASSPSPISSS